uniref:Uncharacterized protein n=1 Tax=Ditylenchus dipsaci TaxID=166011 RepID=A0A915EAF8_9BILA
MKIPLFDLTILLFIFTTSKCLGQLDDDQIFPLGASFRLQEKYLKGASAEEFTQEKEGLQSASSSQEETLLEASTGIIIPGIHTSTIQNQESESGEKVKIIEDIMKTSSQRIDQFPTPFTKVPITQMELIEKAKQFARKYLTVTQLRKLHDSVRKHRKSGADQDKIRQVVTRFLNRTLSRRQKAAIEADKLELEENFGAQPFNSTYESISLQQHEIKFR